MEKRTLENYLDLLIKDSSELDEEVRKEHGFREKGDKLVVCPEYGILDGFHEGLDFLITSLNQKNAFIKAIIMIERGERGLDLEKISVSDNLDIIERLYMRKEFYGFLTLGRGSLKREKKIVINKYKVVEVNDRYITLKRISKGNSQTHVTISDAWINRDYEFFLNKKDLRKRLESLKEEKYQESVKEIERVTERKLELEKQLEKTSLRLKELEKNFMFEDYRIGDLLCLNEEELWKDC